MRIKKIKYNMVSFILFLKRTFLKRFYKIKLPFSKNIKFGKHVKVGAGTRFYKYNGLSNIGENTVICNYSKFILGDGKLEIGCNCLLGEYGIYNVFSDLIIGNDVITADRISFVTNIHQYEDISVPIKNQPSTSDSILIGDGTWIGMNSTILAGSSIGKNCVIGANSVVKGKFPDYCVIVGAPAKIVKKYNLNTNKWEKV